MQNMVKRGLRPIIPQELALRQQLFEAMQGDVVLNIMETLGCIETPIIHKRECLREANAIKVGEANLGEWSKEFSTLYGTFKDVKDTLCSGLNVDLYLIKSDSINAFAASSPKPNEPHIITLTTPLVKALSKGELRFVLGHEIGHLIDDSHTLRAIKQFVYPNDNQFTGHIEQKWLLWRRLEEMLADQYGYIAANSLQDSISAISKVSNSLIGYQEEGLTFDQYLEQNERQLDKIRLAETLCHNAHPLNPIRIQAIHLFSQQGKLGIDEYLYAIDELVELQYKLRESEIDTLIPIFLTIAGMMMAQADNEVTNEEKERIIEKISEYQLCPVQLFEYVCNADNQNIILDRIASRLMKLDPNTPALLIEFLAELAIVDKRLKKEEVEELMNIGVNKLNMVPRQVATILAKVIGEKYNPSITTL